MEKPDFIASCCGQPIEDCSGCSQGTMLIRKNDYMSKEKEDKPEEMTESLKEVMTKIESRTATADDFNRLIKEATPEAARDRVRRRQSASQNTVRSHQDEDGHSDLKPPVMADRVQPKREREDRTQMQHGGKRGHRHSARTQKRTMSKSLAEAIEFIEENIGQPIDQRLLADIEDRSIMHAFATKLMAKPGINRDWLSDFCAKLEDKGTGKNLIEMIDDQHPIEQILLHVVKRNLRFCRSADLPEKIDIIHSKIFAGGGSDTMQLITHFGDNLDDAIGNAISTIENPV